MNKKVLAKLIAKTFFITVNILLYIYILFN